MSQGITNSAPANVLMKSDGVNAVASSVSDDGSAVYHSQYGTPATLILRAANGTSSSPTILTNGDDAGIYKVFGYNGGGNNNGFVDMAHFEVFADAPFSSGQTIPTSIYISLSDGNGNFSSPIALKSDNTINLGDNAGNYDSKTTVFNVDGSIKSYASSTPADGELLVGKTSTGTFEKQVMFHSAASAPGVNDDAGDGYQLGTTWINTTADDAYICLDTTVGAAVWKKTTP